MLNGNEKTHSGRPASPTQVKGLLRELRRTQRDLNNILGQSVQDILHDMGRLLDTKELGVTGDSLSFTLMNSYLANITLLGLSQISKQQAFAKSWRIFCLDDLAWESCKESLQPEVCVRTRQTFAKPSDFLKEQFKQIGMLKMRIGLELLESDESLKELAIFDGDVMHLNFTQKLADDKDLMFQADNLMKHPAINLGQLLVRNAPEIIELFTKVLRKKHGWDQDLFNQHRFIVPAKKQKHLPRHQYASACWGGSKDWQRHHTPITFHANCITGSKRKARAMKQYQKI